ncbi:MAG: ABC transporter permease, partial [Bacteroidota bacterium]
MLRHAILIFFRNFKRYKTASFINLFGLSIGLASALLIYLWVNDELTMDHFGEKDSNRHYQVMVNANTPNGVQTRETTPGPLTETLEKEFPEVDYAIPITADSYYEGILSFETEYVRATPQFVGEGYFNVFRCDFVSGGKEVAFSDKNNIVISEKVALGLFRSIDQAIGKTVTFKSEMFNGPYSVSGVFTPDDDASLKFDILFSYDHFIEKRPGLRKWYNGGVHAHLVLNEGVDLKAFNAKIKDFLG